MERSDMPAAVGEVIEMKKIIDDYLAPRQADELFSRLYSEVAEKSVNLSFKTSIRMLYCVFKREEGVSQEEKVERIQAEFNKYYNLPWWHPKGWLVYIFY
jgi:hypothetical protein